MRTETHGISLNQEQTLRWTWKLNINVVFHNMIFWHLHAERIIGSWRANNWAEKDIHIIHFVPYFRDLGSPRKWLWSPTKNKGDTIKLLLPVGCLFLYLISENIVSYQLHRKANNSFSKVLEIRHMVVPYPLSKSSLLLI